MPSRCTRIHNGVKPTLSLRKKSFSRRLQPLESGGVRETGIKEHQLILTKDNNFRRELCGILVLRQRRRGRAGNSRLGTGIVRSSSEQTGESVPPVKLFSARLSLTRLVRLNKLSGICRRICFLAGRFVRLVRNLDVLERVYTIETQIMQIMDAIGIQNRVVVVNVSVDDEQRPKSSESTETCSIKGK
ncbi:unnamed protein product [Brassica napus]|uniref:(rape) hypothetical protein n=1 Tax=Brassica napus TaxID=3708 RepID=A0A816HZS5_BRANA|nr:unnamed protein product [Brassica napus]